MICPHCRKPTTVVAGKCGNCAHSLASGAQIATGVLTPFPPAAPVTGGHRDQVTDAPTMAPSTGTSSPVARPGASGPLAPGQTFGSRYHIIRLLGAGGMGAVYQAWDDELGVAVAIKVVRLDPHADPALAADLERRFKRELLLAREVTHKHVVRIHDLGDVDGIKYITMPYVQGHDLATILRTKGPLAVPVAIRLAQQIAEGLQAAHEAGVVHRDLKPGNIMVDEDDDAVIMDFGIARSVSSSGGTMAGAVVGTVEYMAPEQARGESVDHRADIYALGLILYDMLGGRRVSSRSESVLAGLMTRMHQAPPPLRQTDAEIPEALDRIVTCCLQPAVSARYQATADLVSDLCALTHPRPAGGRTDIRGPLHLPPPVMTPAPWRPARWLMGAAVVMVLAAAGAAILNFGARTAVSAPVVAPSTSVSLAILPFRNATGDPSLDWLGLSFAEMVRSELGQSSHLRTIPSERLQQVLRDLRISPDASFEPTTLRRLAEFSSSDTVLWGQFLKFGAEIRFDATLEDVKGGRAIPLKAQALNEALLLGTVTDVAHMVRQALAFPPDIIAALQATALKPSSQSLAAIRFYNEGMQLTREGKRADALKRFEAATAEDPEFALAYSRLGQAHAALGYDNEAEQFSRKAIELSDTLPAREQYLIQASHARVVNDVPKAIESYVNLLKAAPDDAQVQFDLAKLYEDTGALDSARDLYIKVVERDANYMEALLALGRVEIRRRNPQDSLDYLNRALSLAIQVDSQEPKANILNAIGIAYKRLNKPAEALRYYTESLAIKRTLGQNGPIAGTLNEIAQVQLQLGKAPEALKTYREALQLRRQIGDTRGTGNTLLDLGAFHAERGQYDQALELYKESLQIWRQVGDANYEAATLNNIGNAYMISGRYGDALTYFERALQLREKSNVPAETAIVLQNLAATSTRLGSYDGALKYHLRALALWRAAGDQRQAALEGFRMAEVFEQQGLFGAALKAQTEALATVRGLQDRSLLAEMLAGYGGALSQVGSFDEAAKALDEALALARELQQQGTAALALNLAAHNRLLKGEDGAARELFDQALRLGTTIKDRRLVLVSRGGIARIDAKQGRGQVAALRALAQEADAAGEKFLAIECAIGAAQALLTMRDFAQARVELERSLVNADRLGARLLQARAHHGLGAAHRGAGRAAEASRHYRLAARLLDAMTKESGTATLLRRADLSAIASAPSGL
jgi:tetratricopeptide (TPR) repeat protein/tRNA A-37 threonylcarbamoyl transferase component Bud32